MGFSVSRLVFSGQRLVRVQDRIRMTVGVLFSLVSPFVLDNPASVAKKILTRHILG